MNVFNKLIEDLDKLAHKFNKKHKKSERFSFLKLLGYEGKVDKVMPFRFFELRGYVIETICLECPEPTFRNERYKIIFSYSINGKLVLIVKDVKKDITYLTIKKI